MDIETVAVIGAGTMGAGIAQICAQAGWKTNLFDAFSEGLEKGRITINEFWEKGIARGKTSPEQKAEWSANMSFHSELKLAVENADLVIEAVPEIIELKKNIFSDLDKYAPARAILATNTSSISIAEIASAVGDPSRVIGMHFFNPVPLMKLLELVQHEKTSQEAIDVAQAAGTSMNKTTILVKNIPGFATSRLGVILGNEAIRMLADGVASASDIDTAMVLGYRHPMGPLELTDLVGLDVRRDILLNLQKSFNDDSYAPHPLLQKLVSDGALGKKTGKGIYDWKSGSPVERNL
ncbi:MAG: 3-hydroxyacyl-CoA dehydrogenase family protein [Candidatus Poseidoniales archaeon]|jgi:3-hydroxybutyryl-CoA dehydrogenase